jgi:hypothetical protein
MCATGPAHLIILDMMYLLITGHIIKNVWRNNMLAEQISKLPITKFSQ